MERRNVQNQERGLGIQYVLKFVISPTQNRFRAQLTFRMVETVGKFCFAQNEISIIVYAVKMPTFVRVRIVDLEEKYRKSKKPGLNWQNMVVK